MDASMNEMAHATHLGIKYWSYHDEKLPVLILIHGFTGSHKGFMYLEPLLANYHLIIPDLPGFGESDLPDAQQWSIDALADMLNTFVESLNLSEPPHILGHSMGGLVVSSMVARHPDLYHDIVLISPVPTAIRRNDSRAPGAVLGALQYRIAAKTGRLGSKLMTSKTISRFATDLMTRTSDRERKAAIREHHFENLDFISSIHFYEKLYHDINRQGSIDHAQALQKKRILIITGDQDNVTPLREEKRLAESIQPEKFVVIPRVGHLIHYERPEEAAEAIHAFL